MVQTRYTLREHVGDPQEWHFTWQVQDDVNFGSNCDFCGRGGLRITYEVARGEEVAWICENCVGRYNLAPPPEDGMLGPKATRAYAHGLTARLKQQTCHDIIRQVQAEAPDTSLEEVAVYFDRNVQLSPRHAARLFSALSDVGAPDTAKVFEVQTRSKAHQQEFGELTDAERRLIWVALSAQQRRRLASLGFAPEGVQVRLGQGRRRRPEILLAAPRIPVLREAAALVPDEKPKHRQ